MRGIIKDEAGKAELLSIKYFDWTHEDLVSGCLAVHPYIHLVDSRVEALSRFSTPFLSQAGSITAHITHGIAVSVFVDVHIEFDN